MITNVELVYYKPINLGWAKNASYRNLDFYKDEEYIYIIKNKTFITKVRREDLSTLTYLTLIYEDKEVVIYIDETLRLSVGFFYNQYLSLKEIAGIKYININRDNINTSDGSINFKDTETLTLLHIPDINIQEVVKPFNIVPNGTIEAYSRKPGESLFSLNKYLLGVEPTKKSFTLYFIRPTSSLNELWDYVSKQLELSLDNCYSKSLIPKSSWKGNLLKPICPEDLDINLYRLNK